MLRVAKIPVLRKTAAERQRDFRARMRDRQAAGLPPVATTLEKRAEAERRSLERTARVQAEINKGLTREWVMDQLRHFVLNPADATPAGVQAAKVLLDTLPRTPGADPLASDASVSNTIEYDLSKKESEDDDILLD